MKANTKYTAQEILEAAGVVDPQDHVGVVRVRVAGIPVRTLDHVIKIQESAEKVEVVVGTELYEVILEK